MSISLQGAYLHPSLDGQYFGIHPPWRPAENTRPDFTAITVEGPTDVPGGHGWGEGGVNFLLPIKSGFAIYIYIIYYIPSLKLTYPVKMDGWNTFSFPFGASV